MVRRARINNRNLTEGTIWKQLLLFFIPILFGSFFQQLYSVADAVIVGKFVGKESLAAVDATSSLIRLFLNLFVGISTGATILISQHYGAGRGNEVSRTVHTSITFALAGGAILTVLGISVAPAMLRFMGVPEDIFHLSLTYTRLYFAGSIVSLTYNMGAGILRAVGDSRRPFYFLIIACLTNIVLDFLFVIVFQLNVAGAAIATVVSQAISAVLVVITLARSQQSFRLVFKKLGFVPEILKKVLTVGLPIGVQSCMYPLANMIIQSSINSFGTDTIAAWAVSGKLDFIIWIIIDVFGQTVSTFTAQNYGAGKYSRVLKSTRLCILMSSAIVASISIVMFFGGAQLSRFLVTDENVVSIAFSIIRLQAPFYFVFCFGDVLSGTIRGTGETIKPMLITLTGTCVLRIAWIVFIVPFNPTVRMVIASFPISWVLTSLVFILYFQYFKRKQLAIPPTAS